MEVRTKLVFIFSVSSVGFILFMLLLLWSYSRSLVQAHIAGENERNELQVSAKM